MYKTNYLKVLKVLAFMSWNLNVQQILFYQGREGKGFVFLGRFLFKRKVKQTTHAFLPVKIAMFLLSTQGRERSVPSP